MKRDKPWRPADFPAPLLHIVQSDEAMHDPDLSDAQNDRVDKILAIGFGAAMTVVALFVLIMFASHALAPPTPPGR